MKTKKKRKATKHAKPPPLFEEWKMTQKRLEKTETLKREELADWFIKAVDKQVPEWAYREIREHKNHCKPPFFTQNP